MTIEEMEKAWRSLSSRLEKLEFEQQNLLDNAMRKRRTALDDLALRYKRFSMIGLCCIIPNILFAMSPIIESADYRIWIVAYASCYFLMAAIMDYWLYKGISGMDILAMSVAQVNSLCRFYRKRHHQFMMILFPLAVGFVALLCFACRLDTYFIFGIATGGFLGLVLGTRQYLKFMRDYRVAVSDED